QFSFGSHAACFGALGDPSKKIQGGDSRRTPNESGGNYNRTRSAFLARRRRMPALSKHCLLVVDDEPDLVQSVQDLLRFDFRVLGATRAAEGLKLMKAEKVHIVMTDQRMPEMTGVEFLRALRENFPDTVRLLFTAYADLDAVTDAINTGNVYRYIAK